MTSEKMLEWVRLILWRESLPITSHLRDGAEDTFAEFWYEASDAERNVIKDFITNLSNVLAPFDTPKLDLKSFDLESRILSNQIEAKLAEYDIDLSKMAVVSYELSCNDDALEVIKVSRFSNGTK